MTEKELRARHKVEHQAPDEPAFAESVVYVPAVDIYESDEALFLVVEMPGVDPSNVSIDIHDNRLTLRGNVTVESNEENILLHEYGIGNFYRQFSLGRSIDPDRIEADMKDGVLKLVLRRAEAGKPRKIIVKAG